MCNGDYFRRNCGISSSSLKKRKQSRGKYNDGLYDLRRKIEENAEVEIIITIDSNGVL
ncbi:hypothetical protein ACT7DF_24545 [Bacillus cereus]